MLTTPFNVAELKLPCFDIGLDWEDLAPRHAKTGAAEETIDACRRHVKPSVLIEMIKKKKRPIDAVSTNCLHSDRPTATSQRPGHNRLPNLPIADVWARAKIGRAAQMENDAAEARRRR